jgi:hypothetical protein
MIPALLLQSVIPTPGHEVRDRRGVFVDAREIFADYRDIAVTATANPA